MLKWFLKFIDKYLCSKEKKIIFGQVKRMDAKMCHLMKGTIDFMVKLRIIQEKEITMSGNKSIVSYMFSRKVNLF